MSALNEFAPGTLLQVKITQCRVFFTNFTKSEDGQGRSSDFHKVVWTCQKVPHVRVRELLHLYVISEEKKSTQVEELRVYSRKNDTSKPPKSAKGIVEKVIIDFVIAQNRQFPNSVVLLSHQLQGLEGKNLDDTVFVRVVNRKEKTSAVLVEANFEYTPPPASILDSVYTRTIQRCRQGLCLYCGSPSHAADPSHSFFICPLRHTIELTAVDSMRKALYDMKTALLGYKLSFEKESLLRSRLDSKQCLICLRSKPHDTSVCLSKASISLVEAVLFTESHNLDIINVRTLSLREFDLNVIRYLSGQCITCGNIANHPSDKCRFLTPDTDRIAIMFFSEVKFIMNIVSLTHVSNQGKNNHTQLAGDTTAKSSPFREKIEHESDSVDNNLRKTPNLRSSSAEPVITPLLDNTGLSDKNGTSESPQKKRCNSVEPSDRKILRLMAIGDISAYAFGEIPRSERKLFRWQENVRDSAKLVFKQPKQLADVFQFLSLAFFFAYDAQVTHSIIAISTGKDIPLENTFISSSVPRVSDSRIWPKPVKETHKIYVRAGRFLFTSQNPTSLLFPNGSVFRRSSACNHVGSSINTDITLTLDCRSTVLSFKSNIDSPPAGTLLWLLDKSNAYQGSVTPERLLVSPNDTIAVAYSKWYDRVFVEDISFSTKDKPAVSVGDEVIGVHFKDTDEWSFNENDFTSKNASTYRLSELTRPIDIIRTRKHGTYSATCLLLRSVDSASEVISRKVRNELHGLDSFVTTFSASEDGLQYLEYSAFDKLAKLHEDHMNIRSKIANALRKDTTPP